MILSQNLVHYFVRNQRIRMNNEEDSIQVMVRIAPHRQDHILTHRSPLLTLQTPNNQLEHFTFDFVFGPEASQEDIFLKIGKRVAQNCLRGYNSCVFMYGQTGSGKTYTMTGSKQEPGLLLRTIEYLMQLNSLQEQVDSVLNCSYFQIYNQQVIDLLDNKFKKNLPVRQDLKKGVFIQGLAEESVSTLDQLNRMLTRGKNNRHVHQTQMNKESSRSHSVFTLQLMNVDKSQKPSSYSAKLHFVDLAGSQRQKRTQAKDERLKQASNINKSLSNLGNVINQLSKNRGGFIKFRDSKLTFILQDSLGGNSKTYMIATVTSELASYFQTRSTLKFAERAKLIKTHAAPNVERKGSIEELTHEIQNLRLKIVQLEGKHQSPQNRIYVLQEMINNLRNQMAQFLLHDCETHAHRPLPYQKVHVKLQETLRLKSQIRQMTERLANDHSAQKPSYQLLKSQSKRKRMESVQGCLDESLQRQFEQLRNQLIGKNALIDMLSSNSSLCENNRLLNQIQEMKIELVRKQAQLLQARRAQEEHKNESQQLRDKLDSAVMGLQLSQIGHQQTKLQLDTLKNFLIETFSIPETDLIDGLQQYRAEVQQLRSTLSQYICQSASKMQRTSEQIRQRDNLLQTLQVQNKLLKRQLQEVYVQKESLNGQLQASNSLLTSLKNQISETQNKVQELTDRLLHQQNEQERLEVLLQSKSQQIQSLIYQHRITVKGLQQTNSRMSQEVSSLRCNNQQLVQEQKSRQFVLLQMQTRLDELKRQTSVLKISQSNHKLQCQRLKRQNQKYKQLADSLRSEDKSLSLTQQLTQLKAQLRIKDIRQLQALQHIEYLQKQNKQTKATFQQKFKEIQMKNKWFQEHLDDQRKFNKKLMEQAREHNKENKDRNRPQLGRTESKLKRGREL